MQPTHLLASSTCDYSAPICNNWRRTVPPWHVRSWMLRMLQVLFNQKNSQTTLAVDTEKIIELGQWLLLGPQKTLAAPH